MFFDGLTTLVSFGFTTCFQEASQLVHPSRILPPYQRLVVFYHFYWFVFMRIVLYGVYHVIPHPPMKFQADTLCFGWILEVVTLRRPVCLSPRPFLPKTSWIDMRLGGPPSLVSQEPMFNI